MPTKIHEQGHDQLDFHNFISGEERKDRLHQNYLRHKANGKQKECEDRIKTEKRQKMEAKKAALRAEDMAKGVFYIAGSLPQQEPQKAVMQSTNII